MKGMVFVALVATGMSAAPLAAQSRDTAATANTSAPSVSAPAYSQKRQDLVKDIQATQTQLTQVKSQRLSLESRIDNVEAAMMQQRAQALLLSNDQNALQQLDAVLTASQNNLAAQRDRFASLSDAVRNRTGAVLVVLLRADSAPGQTIGDASLVVDNASASQRSYTPASNNALSIGAVDQLYRAVVLPTSHSVELHVTANGQALVQRVNVNASGETVTYVQFVVRNGQIVPLTWTTRGTTPF